MRYLLDCSDEEIQNEFECRFVYADFVSEISTDILENELSYRADAETDISDYEKNLESNKLVDMANQGKLCYNDMYRFLETITGRLISK